MSKNKLAAIIIPCVIAIIVVTVISTNSPKDTREPEQIAVSAYDFANQLFDPQLTSLQRQDIWEDYEGKQVKWINELKDVGLEEELVAHFLNPLDWKRTEVKAVFDGSESRSLLEAKEGDLVIYTGILDDFGKAEISLTDCTVVSLAVVRLWWNNDIDTRNKRILVGDEVLCLGPSTYDDATVYRSPKITAINRETGELLWEGKKTRSVLVGIDSQYIYACWWRLSQYASREWSVQSNIEASNEVSGQIAWTSLLSESIYCPERFLGHELSLSDCLYFGVVGGSVKEEIINKAESGPIFLIDKPPLSELAYEYEGVIYESGSSSYGVLGEGRYALQAIDQKTGDILWIAIFGYTGMTDFSIVDGIVYVSADNGVGAFELPNVTDLQNPNSSETGI